MAYVNRAQITFQNDTYQFVFKRLNPLGMPTLDRELRKTHEEMCPPHLAFTILHTFVTSEFRISATNLSLSGVIWDMVATAE